MKHAGPATLERLGPLLAEIRALGLFKEPRPGTFYRGSRAALHFHEDPAGIFADLRGPHDLDFTRLPVTTRAEQDALLGALTLDPV